METEPSLPWVAKATTRTSKKRTERSSSKISHSSAGRKISENSSKRRIVNLSQRYSFPKTKKRTGQKDSLTFSLITMMKCKRLLSFKRPNFSIESLPFIDQTGVSLIKNLTKTNSQKRQISRKKPPRNQTISSVIFFLEWFFIIFLRNFLCSFLKLILNWNHTLHLSKKKANHK